jgi:nitrogen fixation protein NifU and related proteins
MSELSELYQEVILDHNRKPRNYRRLVDANRSADGYNPLCGDQLTVYLKLEDGVISDVGFQGSGCAISKASASIMTTTVKGKTPEEAGRLFGIFHRLVTDDAAGPDLDAVGRLAVFAGVREFPARVKCATLAWHTLRAALEGGTGPVKTE